MTGDVITGILGTISFGSTPTAVKITKWSLKKSASPINVSDNGSAGFEEFKPAKNIGWTGSFTGFMRVGVTPPAINSIVAFSGVADTGSTYSGNVIITEEGFDVDTVGGNAVQVSRNFTGTGTLTEVHT
jgi:hypothetical protein